MLIFNKREKLVHELLQAYLDLISRCSVEFHNLLLRYLDHSSSENLESLVNTIATLEARADDQRRSIEDMLYAKALLPEARGDILGLIENADRIANKYESFGYIAICQKIHVYPLIKDRTSAISEVTKKCVLRLMQLINDLYFEGKGSLDEINEIIALESEVDVMQFHLISDIFSSTIPDLQKILLRDWINHLCSITNLAENIADRLKLVVMKSTI